MTPPVPDASRLGVLRDLVAAYARRTPVRTIAVVGNAPLVASDARADAIDACDLVVRVNSFTTDEPGEPRAAGRRTDVVLWSRLVRATRRLYDDYPSRLYVMLEPMRMYHRPEVWPTSWPADLGFVVAPNDLVAQPLLEDLGLPWRTEALAPTSGTTAAWLARRLFPDAALLVTGLSYVAEDPQRWDYQSGASGKIGPEHRVAAEGALLRGWIEDGSVRFWPSDRAHEEQR
ncbi:hypothetical protein [Nocardioides sp. Root190]|uniref:hypothetical protein n=1 Tax=Nocardioides sp. Root190 TaxID=1736488 RepID=UPI0019103B24|nr:hypothetical protein [Nocardioides sp. Root190]